MKITAVYNPKSGGSYHRVKLWSEFVENVTLVQELTEELVSNCDILYIHWNSKTALTQLSIWREKYGFKIIADVDDTWKLGEKFTYSVFLSQHLCLLADHVICSTEYLVQDIMEWNKNITVIPNLIPVGHGQFTPKPVKTNSKLVFGIGGSISHYEDYMSLSKLIKELEKDKWFKKNCEFAIIGYDAKNPKWQDVSKMFKTCKIYKAKSPEEYMSLYDNLDYMLMPLLDTNINKGRSGVKILECFTKGVVPIVSDEYEDKTGWENAYSLKLFATFAFYHNNRLEIIASRLEENILKGAMYMSKLNYQKDCVDSRLEVFNKIQPKLEDKHDLYSITYNSKQNVEYKRINNHISTIDEKSYLFEYNKIIEYVECWETYSKDSYLAFFSHKFPHKTGFYRKYVEEILNNEDSDVVVFCNQSDNYLLWTEQQHPGFMDIFIKVCQKLELVIPPDNILTIYSNFFAAKANVYKDYVEVLKKAIDIMETDSEIRELCWKDAGYKTGLNSEDLKKYTGLDYYPFHTFILERLMSIWIVNKKLSYSVYT